MKREPVWMDDIRKQIKKSPYYGQIDEELEEYEKDYLRAIKMLDRPKKRTIVRYVEQMKKCWHHHARISFLEGLEAEKTNHKYRRDAYYKCINDGQNLKGILVAKVVDILLSCPELTKRYETMEENQMKLYTLLDSLSEEDQKFLRSYLDNLSDFYAVMFHIAAGMPKCML